MPGKGHIPELTERIIRSMKANTNRTAGGLGSNASPGLTRDRIAASARTSSGIAPTARSSKIDDWDITGTGTSSFTTTYAPIRDSWNLKLNGVDVHRDEFTVVGRTVTILSPTDLFKGVTTQGSPWNLEMQYDYLTAAPTAPISVDGTFAASQTTTGNGSSPSVTIPTNTAGQLLVMGIVTQSDPTSTPTGWTYDGFVNNAAGTMGLGVYHKVSAGGETVAAMTKAGSGSYAATVLAYDSATYAGISTNASPAASTSHVAPSGAVGLLVYFWGRLTGGAGVTVADATERSDIAGINVATASADKTGSGTATATLGVSVDWVAATVRLT